MSGPTSPTHSRKTIPIPCKCDTHEDILSPPPSRINLTRGFFFVTPPHKRRDQRRYQDNAHAHKNFAGCVNVTLGTFLSRRHTSVGRNVRPSASRVPAKFFDCKLSRVSLSTSETNLRKTLWIAQMCHTHTHTHHPRNTFRFLIWWTEKALTHIVWRFTKERTSFWSLKFVL
jgi:hypothetical protein